MRPSDRGPEPPDPVGETPLPPPEAHPPPRDPPWRVWESLALVGLFFGAQFIVAIAGAALGEALFPHPGGIAGRVDRALYTLPPTLLVSYLISGLAVYWLIVRRYRLSLLDALGLGIYPPGRLLLPFIGGSALQFSTAILVAGFPPPEDHEFAFDIFLRGGAISLTFFFVVAVVLAPFLEEVLFRGLMLPAMRRAWGFPIASVVVTTLFTALHAFQTGFYWPALVGIGTCGWLLAWLRERSGALWPSVVFHVGFNVTAFLPVFFLADGG